jgi:hypothetical protein
MKKQAERLAVANSCKNKLYLIFLYNHLDQNWYSFRFPVFGENWVFLALSSKIMKTLPGFPSQSQAWYLILIQYKITDLIVRSMKCAILSIERMAE